MKGAEGDNATTNLKNPNSETRVNEIKRMLDGESFLVDIDQDSSISRDIDFQATYGDLPKLGDPPRPEPDAFQ